MGCSLLFLSSSALLFLLSLRLLLLFYCCSSSSSSSSSSPTGHCSSTSSPPLGSHFTVAGAGLSGCGHSTNNSPAASTAGGDGGSGGGTGGSGGAPSSSSAHHTTTPPTIYDSSAGSQGVFTFGVPMAAQGAARIVLTAHVSPDTYAAAGRVAALCASNGMVPVILMTEETANVDHGSWDPLPPGRRNTDFVFGAIACWWWCRRYGTLSLVRVHIFDFRQV